MKLPKTMDGMSFSYLMMLLDWGKAYKVARISRDSVEIYRKKRDWKSADFWAALNCTAERMSVDETASEDWLSPGLDGNQSFGAVNTNYEPVVWLADRLIPILQKHGELEYECRVRFERALALDRMGRYCLSLPEFEAALKLANQVEDDWLWRMVNDASKPARAYAYYGGASAEFLWEVKNDLGRRQDFRGVLRALEMGIVLWREAGRLDVVKWNYQEMLEVAADNDQTDMVEVAEKALAELAQSAA